MLIKKVKRSFVPYAINIENEDEHRMILDVLNFSSGAFTRVSDVAKLLDCIGQVQQGAEAAEWKL